MGVKVRLCVLTPAPGRYEGELKVKVPFTLALPPLRVAAERARPSVMIAATGSEVSVGVALAMVKSTILLPLKLGSVDVTVRV